VHLKQVDKALRQGAQAHGFGTDLWTLPRVAAVIERTAGVHYHSSHVWKILEAMEWSLQRPAKRGRERNDEGQRLWMAKAQRNVFSTTRKAADGTVSHAKPPKTDKRNADGTRKMASP
jgi:hypothetical protein